MTTIGFTFDEQVLKDTCLSGFFNSLPFRPNHLELAPDETLLELKTYKAISQFTDNLNFHIPYFLGQRTYDFTSRDFSDLEKFFIIVDHLRPFSIKTPSIVFHGSSDKDPIQAHDQTRRGLDQALNFIEKKNLDLILCLENTECSNSSSRYSLDQVLQLTGGFQSPRLKVCYDLAHAYYGCQDFSLPAPDVLEMISYFHLHGKHSLKHQDLIYLPKDLIKGLMPYGDHTIELLKASCQKDYSKTLGHNMAYLSDL